MSSDCPYNKCSGNGLVFLKNQFGEVKTQFCKCRDEKLQDKRLQFANIPTEFSELTVKSYNTELYTKEYDKQIARIAKRKVSNYVKQFEEYELKGKGLYLFSNTKGSGKTRLSVSLGNALLSIKHKQVKFITMVDMLREIKNTYNKESKSTESQLIESINNVGILILDDIGVEQPTLWVNEILNSIFDTRMKYQKVTIFTSNCAMENLDHDDRVKSRIFKMAMPIKMPEEDIRISQSKEENRVLQDQLLKG